MASVIRSEFRAGFLRSLNPNLTFVFISGFCTKICKLLHGNGKFLKIVLFKNTNYFFYLFMNDHLHHKIINYYEEIIFSLLLKIISLNYASFMFDVRFELSELKNPKNMSYHR